MKNLFFSLMLFASVVLNVEGQFASYERTPLTTNKVGVLITNVTFQGYFAGSPVVIGTNIASPFTHGFTNSPDGVLHEQHTTDGTTWVDDLLIDMLGNVTITNSGSTSSLTFGYAGGGGNSATIQFSSTGFAFGAQVFANSFVSGFNGDIVAGVGGKFTGSGAGLTTLNASAITTGTVPPANLPIATTSAFGVMKPDGTTITSAGGVMSAVGGGGGGGGSSGLFIGFAPTITAIMTQSGNTANVIPLGTISGNMTGNPFSSANDIFSQTVCPQDSWVSNMWLKISDHVTQVAYAGTGTNYCAGIATNGVVVPFSVLSVYFKSDGSTTKTNSGTESVFIKAGTIVTCIVSNANASALAPDLGVTVPFYQLGGGGGGTWIQDQNAGGFSLTNLNSINFNTNKMIFKSTNAVSGFMLLAGSVNGTNLFLPLVSTNGL